MTQPLIKYHITQHVATITMNDPKTLNAFSTPLKAAMMDALEQADADEQVRVIVLQGAGQNFSSGGHIGEMLENGMDSDALADKINFMVSEVSEISLKLRNIHKPIIAKLEGAVAGAGMNLALTCDFRIAANNAKFVQAFVNIGLIPDAGGIYLLNQLIGAAKTTELVMLGDKLNEALDMEVHQQTMMAQTEDFKEGIMAFMEKRSPIYQGK